MSRIADYGDKDFGPYEICEYLGHGGMATVVRAIERDTGRVVALKRLLPHLASDEAHIQQFVREANIAQALKHPNIVEVYGYGEIEGVHYLSMEWFQGKTLREVLAVTQGALRMPAGVTLWVLSKILGALDHAMTGLNEEGDEFQIVHRDVSPSNIIVTPEAEVKIIDFGVAKSLVGQYATNSGHIKGKMGYMAPEILAGKGAGVRSDLYSVAVLVWELLAGRRLFAGSEMMQLDMRLKHKFKPPSSLNPAVSPEIDDLLAVALSEDPDARWPNAAAMHGVLDVVVRRYGDAASQEALLEWLQDPLVVTEPPMSEAIVSDERRDQMTTLPVSGRKVPGVRRFAPQVKTEIDPIFDASERHRRTTESDT